MVSRDVCHETKFYRLFICHATASYNKNNLSKSFYFFGLDTVYIIKRAIRFFSSPIPANWRPQVELAPSLIYTLLLILQPLAAASTKIFKAELLLSIRTQFAELCLCRRISRTEHRFVAYGFRRFKRQTDRVIYGFKVMNGNSAVGTKTQVCWLSVWCQIFRPLLAHYTRSASLSE